MSELGENYAILAAAIIERAALDYVAALRRKSAHNAWAKDMGCIEDCESFFRGEWFMLLSYGDYDGEKIINVLQRRAGHGPASEDS